MILPALIVYKLNSAIIMGGVFHETFVSFVTFAVYMFKDSNLLVGKEELLKTACDVKLMLR